MTKTELECGQTLAVVLHLSDLHFKSNESPDEANQRRMVLESLLDKLGELEKDWQPNVVCVSGDIGWGGKKGDYMKAVSWFGDLLKTLQLTPDSLVLCPGNHDRNLDHAPGTRPNQPDKADRDLGLPLKDCHLGPFKDFEKHFCEELKVPPLSLGDEKGHLVGTRDVLGITFVGVNSAWYTTIEEQEGDKGQLWIGKPHLEHLAAHSQIPKPEALAAWPPIVALMHHSREWLHDAEINARGNRPNTYDFLTQRCHLLLTGHNHGEMREADKSQNAYVFTDGASFAGRAHHNNFALIQVRWNGFTRRAFESKPRSSRDEWTEWEEPELPIVRESANASGLEITIAVDPGDFDEVAFIRVIRRIIELGEVRVVSKKVGSVKLTLQLAAEDAGKLCRAIQRGDLDHLHVSGAEWVDLESAAKQELPIERTGPGSNGDGGSLISVGSYKEALKEWVRTTQLGHRHLHIDENYFPLKATRIIPEPQQTGELIDEVLLKQTVQRICVVGPSGAGKTAAMRRLIWAALAGNDYPFYVALRDYTEPLKGPVPLRDWIVRSVTRFESPERPIADELAECIDQRRGIFVFDGFDELRSNSRWAVRIAEKIEAYFANQRQARVVITARAKEDLQALFASYHSYMLQVVELDEIENFALTMGEEFSAVVSGLHDMAERRLFEPRPILLILVLLYMLRKRGGGREASSLFDVLNQAINELLADPEERQLPPISRIERLRREGIRALRMGVLLRTVRQWKVSAKPCRIARKEMERYVTAELGDRTEEDHRVTPEEMEFLIPTGICLEVVDCEGLPYGFVHNSIQEFLYARLLLDAIHEKNNSLFERDYYSTETMKMLGQAVDLDDVAQLLTWVRDRELSVMVRKVSARVLGFVGGSEPASGLPGKLKDAFEREKDVGVAGRIAEALRRHGDRETFLKFVHGLDDYPSRRTIGANEESKPLTFEILEPLKLRPETERDLVPELYAYLRKSPNPSTRKHALIVLMRMRPSLPREIVVDYCLREVERIEDLPKSADRVEKTALVRSLRYGLEALRWCGSGIERGLASEMFLRLTDLTSYSMDEATRGQFSETEQELRERDWLHDVLVAGQDEDRPLVVYVGRHAESEANTKGRLVGIGPDKGGLSPRGSDQARLLAEKLKRDEGRKILLVTSPARRAKDTARAIADRLDLELEEDRRLAELDYGAWTGWDVNDICSKDSEVYRRWRDDAYRNRPSEGESMFTVRSRVFEALGAWAARAVKEDMALVVITHYFPFIAIHDVLAPKARKPCNCSLSRFRLQSGRLVPNYLTMDDYLGEHRSKPVKWS